MLTFITLCLLTSQAPVATITADEVMQHVRKATGFSVNRLPATGLQLVGKGTYAGMPARYEVLFNRDGHFVQTVTSKINTGMGYDGSNAWVRDLAGEQRIQELTDRRNTLFTGLLITNLWIDAGSGMQYTLPADSLKEGVYSLSFTHTPTQMKGTVRIDGKTWLPVDCTVTVEGRKMTTKWNGSVEFLGMKFPQQIQAFSSNEGVEAFTIESIQAAPTFVRNPYAALDVVPSDTVFDNAVPAELEVKRAKTGHLLVKPKVNGKSVGWFIFDSGAGANVLANSVIKELQLEQFGELPAVGIGGAVKTHFSRPDSLTIGRATLKQPLVIGLDLAFLDIPMGEHIAGIVGYGTFHRCVVEMDMDKNTIALFDPKDYDQSRVNNRWQKLYQTARVSCVEAEFEGHKGIFKLDTGAAGSTVALHAPIVEKLKLLENRETSDSMTGGVGGMLKAKKGKLKYFQIADEKFENVEVTFATASKGAFNSADTMGNIGGDLVKPFKLVFDYQNKRIAFVRRTGSE